MSPSWSLFQFKDVLWKCRFCSRRCYPQVDIFPLHIRWAWFFCQSLSLKSQFYRLNLFKKIFMLLLPFLQILFELPACLILLVCIIRHLDLKVMVLQGAKNYYTANNCRFLNYRYNSHLIIHDTIQFFRG